MLKKFALNISTVKCSWPCFIKFDLIRKKKVFSPLYFKKGWKKRIIFIVRHSNAPKIKEFKEFSRFNNHCQCGKGVTQTYLTSAQESDKLSPMSKHLLPLLWSTGCSVCSENPVLWKLLPAKTENEVWESLRAECLLFPGQGALRTSPFLASLHIHPSSMQLSGDFAHFRVPWTAHQSHLGASCLLWAPQRAPEKAQEGAASIKWHFSLFYRTFVRNKCVVDAK